ncbi:hypothetical protein C922_02717 [Plasmodium inui San Antonio 1]|uniref:Uncharacterized protein n=1 Tax=Plasmodium inui San Antonio 1 TaxID=1237626 RepID=W7A0N5_9APIC|nr:hypothetical protein C922_02717 [Plasmodium inui San Antonio 1]EUD66732.1 hypothetical protein C922_02717 [Plasmodium inui San Antonio 1]
MIELCLLEGVYAEWLSGEFRRSYSDEMAAHEGDSYTKRVTFGEDNHTTVTDYAYGRVRNKNELRKQQRKVTLLSVSRCFKLVNDGVFLLKMVYQLCGKTEWENLHDRPIHTVAFIWLLCLHITSHCTFHLRKYFILNMIPEEHHDLFSLFGVFKKVTFFREEDLPILCFYSRMEKTYMFVNKFLEDIPQFVLYLLDAFIECDAAPTNKFFCLYAGVVFSVWSLVALATVTLVGARWTPLVYVQFVALLLLSMAFLLSFLYCHFGAKQRFYLNPYYCLGADKF